MHSILLKSSRGLDHGDERYRWANERSAVPPGTPGFRIVVACDVSTLALRNRRSRAIGVFLDRSTSRCRPGMVAGVAARPDRLRQLTVSISIVVCRQRLVDQSGCADRGQPAPGGRL